MPLPATHLLLHPQLPIQPDATEHPPNKYAKHAPICSSQLRPSSVCLAHKPQIIPAATNANRKEAK
jgi:hypothetical protein